ncbi:MAG: hypothetical protein WC631_00105 [Candidatus Paceibacterota bacterium]|jgi:hypothetical protein
MKTAIILPTAFITTTNSNTDSKNRIDQYAGGLEQMIVLARKHPMDFDFYLVDSTLADPSVIDDKIKNVLSKIPNLKTCFFLNNEAGRKNKGAGLIIQWQKILSVIGERYKYIISFEPRQKLENFIFFERFLSDPNNYFRVERVLVRKYKIFTFRLVQIMTGLVAIESLELKKYVDNVSIKWMLMMKISIERDLYKFIINNRLSYKEVPYLNVIWHDSFNDKLIRI